MAEKKFNRCTVFDKCSKTNATCRTGDDQPISCIGIVECTSKGECDHQQKCTALIIDEYVTRDTPVEQTRLPEPEIKKE